MILYFIPACRQFFLLYAVKNVTGGESGFVCNSYRDSNTIHHDVMSLVWLNHAKLMTISNTGIHTLERTKQENYYTAKTERLF